MLVSILYHKKYILTKENPACHSFIQIQVQEYKVYHDSSATTGNCSASTTEIGPSSRIARLWSWPTILELICFLWPAWSAVIQNSELQWSWTVLSVFVPPVCFNPRPSRTSSWTTILWRIVLGYSTDLTNTWNPKGGACGSIGTIWLQGKWLTSVCTFRVLAITLSTSLSRVIIPV